MKESYLEVTYHRGALIAAYLYLPRQSGEKSHRTSKVDPGMIVDFNESGKPIGIEITAPSIVTAKDINSLLKNLGLSEIVATELTPLRAA